MAGASFASLGRHSRVKDVEQAKAELAVDDPSLLDLAAEGAQLIDEIGAKGPLQEALVREVTSST